MLSLSYCVWAPVYGAHLTSGQEPPDFGGEPWKKKARWGVQMANRGNKVTEVRREEAWGGFEDRRLRWLWCTSPRGRTAAAPALAFPLLCARVLGRPRGAVNRPKDHQKMARDFGIPKGLFIVDSLDRGICIHEGLIKQGTR